MKYEVIEDNGGGLHLAVFDNGECTYLHSGYEYHPGRLTEDLKALNAGDEPALDWDGNSDDPQAGYDDLTSHEHGWKIVATDGTTNPDSMGAAARVEFGET